MRTPRPHERFSRRAFQALLALYPAAFRDEYGRELSLVFTDRYRDATTRWDRAQLWVEAVVGILREAPQEHARMIVHDLRDGCRALRRHALVTATIVVTLALGIGANTAVFSLLNAVAVRSPLPVEHAEQLYVVNRGRHVAEGAESARLSGPGFDLLRNSAPDGVQLAAMSRGVARVYTRIGQERETVPASLQLVSSNLFPVLGVPAALGRLLPEANGTDANQPLAVISYAYWQRRFGGSPDAVGRQITINGASFTIIGIGARGFAGVWLETPVDIWVPLTAQPIVQYTQSFTADGANLGRPWLPQSGIWWLHVVARVPPGQATAVTGAFNASLSRLEGRDAGVALQPFAQGFSRFRQQFSTPLMVLMVMATLVLLAACANVANLLLTRGVGRQRELAVRMALGAGRARVFHQLLIESALIVIMAGAAAVAFARWAGDALLRVAIDGPAPFAAPIDFRVLVFAAAVALLSLVLVTGTGLFVRSFLELLHLDLGFEPRRVLTVRVDPKLAGVPARDLPETYRRVLDEIARVPGVESTALAMCGLGTCAIEDGYHVEGYQPRKDEVVAFSVNAVTPAYFTTVGTPLLAGRTFNDADREKAPYVAVVNRTLATRYFGEWSQAIGRRFGLTGLDVEIVGIVEDVRGLGNLKAAVMPSVFVPLAQRPVIPREVEIRTSIDPATTMTAVRRAVEAAAPSLPIESLEPAVVLVQRGLSQERLMVLLTSAFAALALGLAAFGLFGILSYAIARRTSEFGLRIALGATPSHVQWSVVRDALQLVLYGVVIGLPLVAIGGRLASGLVFGVSPYDPPTLLAAVLVLTVVGAAAGAGPARRASRVDPMIALREE